MMDQLIFIDTSILHFLNRTIANPIFDVFFPFLTDLNKHWYGLLAYAVGWLFLVVRCGKRGRTVAVLLIVLVAVSDQLSSSLIKALVQRPRPCHLVNGLPVVENLRLLVDCGSGYSFPSSHAVNNFAVATLLSFFYRKWIWAYLSFAALMALSRPYVGVHYPSDIAGGSVIGILCAFSVIAIWQLSVRRYSRLRLES